MNAMPCRLFVPWARETEGPEKLGRLCVQLQSWTPLWNSANQIVDLRVIPEPCCPAAVRRSVRGLQDGLDRAATRRHRVCQAAVQGAMLGLDNSGKSTVIQHLKPKKVALTEVTPTVGFNVEQFSRSSINFTVFDLSLIHI